MKRTKKQDEFFNAFQSGKYSTYFLGGGVGSAKTIGAIMMINAICESCPGARVPVYRKSEKILKNNTIPSFKKVFQMLEKPFDFKDMRIKYRNGSEILFLWADITKDPDCDNAKGGEWTGAFFDEINQIDPKYYEITKTRVGRWNNFEVDGEKFTLKPFIFATCNPTNNWVKSNFYDRFQDGTLPDNVFFQLSLPQDNPFLSKDYLNSLSSLPTEEYNRYVLGDWNYNDDTNNLIKYEWIKNCIREEYEYSDQKKEYLGIDVARYGDDRTIFSHAQDNYFYGFKEFKKQDTVETKERAIISMKELYIGGSSVAVDVVGLGAGVVDGMVHDGYPVLSFNSAETAENRIPFYQFKNRRAESYWMLREALKCGTIEICNNTEVIKELTNMKYIIKDKMISIESKDEIKKRLGYSPDYADALVIAFWASQMKSGNTFFDNRREMKDTIGGNLYEMNF